MSTAPAPNSRASLLAGLRTGGVRSTSGAIPHTAAIGGSFNAHRFPSQHHHNQQEEDDQVLDLPQNLYANNHHGGNRVMPMTAAVDGPNNSFNQQQQRGLNPASVPFSPGFNMMPQSNQAQNQAFQLQMMQLELLKMQVHSHIVVDGEQTLIMKTRLFRHSSTRQRFSPMHNARRSNNNSFSPKTRDFLTILPPLLGQPPTASISVPPP